MKTFKVRIFELPAPSKDKTPGPPPKPTEKAGFSIEAIHQDAARKLVRERLKTHGYTKVRTINFTTDGQISIVTYPKQVK